MGVGADDNMVDKADGVGDVPGGVAIEDADTDVGADADEDGDDEQPLVAVDEMGVGDCERAGVAVEAEAEDNVAEVEHV